MSDDPTTTMPATTDAATPPLTMARWIAALRSGEFEQGTGQLRHSDLPRLTYCCLGVACHLFSPAGWTSDVNYDQSEDQNYMPVHVRQQLGISQEAEDILVKMNDGLSTFLQIADYLEATYLKGTPANVPQ